MTGATIWSTEHFCCCIRNEKFQWCGAHSYEAVLLLLFIIVLSFLRTLMNKLNLRWWTLWRILQHVLHLQKGPDVTALRRFLENKCSSVTGLPCRDCPRHTIKMMFQLELILPNPTKLPNPWVGSERMLLVKVFNGEPSVQHAAVAFSGRFQGRRWGSNRFTYVETALGSCTKL